MTVAGLKKAKGVAGAVAFVAGFLALSYWWEAPKYRFDKMATEVGESVPGARFISSVKVVDVASPITWIWPAETILNFAVPDPLMGGRFFLMSFDYNKNEPTAFLLDVDCGSRDGIWYDQEQPETALPARTLWGDPVVTPNGKTYRRLKTSMRLPEAWLTAFCDTDWKVERAASAAARIKPR